MQDSKTENDGSGLAASLLVALPQLEDPNFRRTAVLMTSHSEEGAMGLVLNRPTPLTVKEFLSRIETPWRGDAAEPIWAGGPVMPQNGWVLFEGTPQSAGPGAMGVMEGLCLTQSAATLRMLALAPPRFFRLFLGYSGWGPGQVESELARGSWLVLPATRELVFETPHEALWARCFEELGIRPDQVIPGDGVQ